MTNNDLADQLSSGHVLSKPDMRRLVTALFAAISEAAARGEEISLTNFGKFKVKSSLARDGRNPATGETIAIKALNKLTFSPAKAVRNRLNG